MMRVGACRYAAKTRRKRRVHSRIVCISHDVFPPLLLLLLPSKWCGRQKREMPLFDFKMLMGGGGKEEKCVHGAQEEHVSVVCARLLAVRCGRSSGKEKKKTKQNIHTHRHPHTKWEKCLLLRDYFGRHI